MCSSLLFHRGVQNYSPHISGITNKTSWQCDFVDLIVNVLRRAGICNQKFLLQPALMYILQKRLSTSIGTKKVLHVNNKVTLTLNGSFCSSISRNEPERSFLSTCRDGLHSLTYKHYNGAEARVRRTPRRRHAKQWHDGPNYQIHTCYQYKGEVILAPLEGNRQTLHERSSNIWHPAILLEQAVHDVLGRHFLTIATSPRHVFAHAQGLWSDRDSRRSRETLCTGDAPAPDKRAAVIETVYFAFKCMPGTTEHGLTGLRSRLGLVFMSIVRLR